MKVAEVAFSVRKVYPHKRSGGGFVRGLILPETPNCSGFYASVQLDRDLPGEGDKILLRNVFFENVKSVDGDKTYYNNTLFLVGSSSVSVIERGSKGGGSGPEPGPDDEIPF